MAEPLGYDFPTAAGRYIRERQLGTGPWQHMNSSQKWVDMPADQQRLRPRKTLRHVLPDRSRQSFQLLPRDPLLEQNSTSRKPTR